MDRSFNTMGNLQRDQVPKDWKEKEARKTRFRWEDYVKRDLERMREEWRTPQTIE